MQGVGLLVLRLTLGLTLVLHGLPKLVPMWGMGPRETEALFVAAGVTPAYAIAVGYGLNNTTGESSPDAGPFSIDRRRARAAEARKLSRTVARAAKK